MSQRVVVRCFSSYRDARRAVDRLRVARIPDTRISVMGRGMRWHGTGGAERSLKLGAGAGALGAAVIALVLWSVGGLAADFTWLGAVFAGAALGGVLGAIGGVVAWRATRDSAAVPETGHVEVGRYDLLVEEGDAPKARELLNA